MGLDGAPGANRVKYHHCVHYCHQSKLCSSEQSSENSVDLAAPIVSALQAPPTKAQVRKALEVNDILCDASKVGDAAGADGDGGLEVVHPQFLSQAQVKTSTPSAEKARQPESHKLIIGDHRKSFQ